MNKKLKEETQTEVTLKDLCIIEKQLRNILFSIFPSQTTLSNGEEEFSHYFANWCSYNSMEKQIFLMPGRAKVMSRGRHTEKLSYYFATWNSTLVYG